MTGRCQPCLPPPQPLGQVYGRRLKLLLWGGLDCHNNDTTELFEMSKPDDNPEQKPVFVVTQSTVNLVQQDFERYRPSLERMVEDWREAKEPLSSENISPKL
jgi:hypothetical protein